MFHKTPVFLFLHFTRLLFDFSTENTLFPAFLNQGVNQRVLQVEEGHKLGSCFGLFLLCPSAAAELRGENLSETNQSLDDLSGNVLSACAERRRAKHAGAAMRTVFR